jgi:hypothetical protein
MTTANENTYKVIVYRRNAVGISSAKSENQLACTGIDNTHASHILKY